jgi:Ca2+-binding RTX toxin-like protein
MSTAHKGFCAILRQFGRLVSQDGNRRRQTRQHVSGELLESRQLLSATSGLGLVDFQEAASTEPVVQLQVQFKVNGVTVDHVDPGQQFQIEIVARDLRDAADQHVALVYFDVLFDTELIDVQSPRSSSSGFLSNGLLRESDGIVDEIEVFNFDTSGAEFTALILNAVAVGDGPLSVTTRAADAGTSSVYSGREAVDLANDVIGFGRSELQIGEATPAPASVPLRPGGGRYELFLENGDLVLQVESGTELFRRQERLVTELSIQGSSEADAVNVGHRGEIIQTPLKFVGGEGDDLFDATAATGGSTLLGEGGNDSLLGSQGIDEIFGGSGNDNLRGSGGNDILWGEAGNDSLFGGAQLDFLQGGEGDDLVDGQGSTGDSVGGGTGNDTVNGGRGNDVLYEEGGGVITLFNDRMEGLGDDVLIGVERVQITGSSGDDRIDVSAFFIPGFTTTTVIGGDGDDTLIGSQGNDVLRGDQGNDLLEGNAGNDYLAGGSGRDTLNGGDGNDRLKGQGGSGDRLNGGAGQNNLDGGSGNDVLVVEVEENIRLTKSNQIETSVRSKFRQIETILLFGSNAANRIDASTFTAKGVQLRAFGGGGNDTLLGSPGNDQLDGGSGNDILQGNAGSDSLTGGDGADEFVGTESELQDLTSDDTFTALSSFSQWVDSI